jgi:hypothetical protein
MSEINGDKARFGRRRKQKLLRRKHYRELRKAMESQQPASAGQGMPKPVVFIG